MICRPFPQVRKNLTPAHRLLDCSNSQVNYPPFSPQNEKANGNSVVGHLGLVNEDDVQKKISKCLDQGHS